MGQRRDTKEIFVLSLKAADVEDINWNQTALMTADCCSKGIEGISA